MCRVHNFLLSFPQDEVANSDADRKLLVEEKKQLEERCEKLEERCQQLEAQVSFETVCAVTLLCKYKNGLE